MAQTIVQLLLAAAACVAVSLVCIAMASLGLKAFSGLTVGVVGRINRRALVPGGECDGVAGDHAGASCLHDSRSTRRVQPTVSNASNEFKDRLMVQTVQPADVPSNQHHREFHVPMGRRNPNPSNLDCCIDALTKDSCLRGAAPSGLPAILFCDHVVADGRQHRACHQLLAVVPKISLAGARRLRRHQSLDAVLFFAVYFGALADRHDCRRVLQAAQLMYAGFL